MTEANQPSEPQADQIESLELKLPDESTLWKDIGLWAGVLALITLITYWPATTGTFLWHDDAVAQNNVLMGPGGLTHIWSDRWVTPEQFKQPMYQPVAGTAYWIEYRLGGHNDQGVPTATAYHIASVVFHALTAILLWLALRELLIPGSWLIAAVFAVHPIHAQDVSWISQQSTALAGMFFCGSVYLYLMFVTSREQDAADRALGGSGIDPAQTWGFAAGAIVCELLAALTHPSTIVLPIVILLLLSWRNRNRSLDLIVQLPLLFIGAVLWFKNVDLQSAQGQISWPGRLEVVGHAIAFVFLKTIFPIGQSIIYTTQPSFLSLILLIAVVGVLGGSYLANKDVFAGLAIAVLLIVFCINWFSIEPLSWVNDSIAYLAVAPIIALVISGLRRIKYPGPHPQSVVTISTVVLLGLGALAWVRTNAFDNPVAMWRDVLRKDPASNLAEASLAEQLRLQAIDDKAQGNNDAVKGELDEAISHAQAVLNRDPNASSAQRTWADVLVARGENSAAATHFETAIKLDPDNPALRAEYAESLIKVGQYQPAIPQLNEALKWDVNSSSVHCLLGQAYAGIGNIDRAIQEQQLALGIDASNFTAREKLALLQIKTGKLEDAVASYAKILGDPTQQNRPEIWVAVAKIKDQQGVYFPAVQYLETAAKLAPDDADITKLLTDEREKLSKAAATRPAATQTFK